MSHRFLFLQGVASPFFSRLGNALSQSGHSVHRINFCGGDALYWPHKEAWDFKEPQNILSDFLREKLEQHAFTDIVLFGDNRPIHQISMGVAKQFGARIFVFEEGYVRPNWVTLERDGVNGCSALPRDPDWYRSKAASLPEYGDGQAVGADLRIRALHDMRYHLANLFLSHRFPHFRTHRPYKAHIEYAGWARRFPILPYHGRRAEKAILGLLARKSPYFLFPLQLDSDAQIQAHSPFSSMDEVITRVLRSFAGHAKSDERLVIKNHPLDTGLINHRRLIKALASEFDISDRILFIDGGHLPTLLDHAAGTITVNSTVGMSALFHHCPTITLGEAIYSLPGLTFQLPLEAFWAGKEPPDGRLYRQFRNVVIHETQVNGGFYSEQGIELAVPGSVKRLTSGGEKS